MTLDPRTPVLVGQAQISQHQDDLSKALGPTQLMAQAVSAAISDAGVSSLGTIDALHVLRSLSNREPNPGRSIARELGLDVRITGLTPHGGNLPQSLVNYSALAIARGEIDMVVLTGGEASRSRRRAKQSEVQPQWISASPESLADETPMAVGDELVMNHEAELALKIALPIQIYPMFETALRAAAQRSVQDHQQLISELWSRFSNVAENNPNAWLHKSYTPEQIRTASPTNRMIGFPYTKLMNSNNDVDMSAALILCSVERATALGIARDQWVFPQAGTDCHEHNFISHRWSFTDTPAIRLGGEHLQLLTGKPTSEYDFIDLYSCFPSAVQLGAQSLGLSLNQQLTQTGGLSFAGGPFNNYVMHAIATTMHKVREQPQAHGFVWANGGYATKHAFGAYAATPPQNGFAHSSPQDQIDALPKRQVANIAEAVGPAKLEAYSVMHGRDGNPETICASVILPDSRRAWATSNDAQLATEMCEREWVGVPVRLDDMGTLLA